MPNLAHDQQKVETEKSKYAGARKQLVERRNALIKSLALASQSEQMEAHMDLIVRIQSVIDVVDRVIDEEARPQC